MSADICTYCLNPIRRGQSHSSSQGRVYHRTGGKVDGGDCYAAYVRDNLKELAGPTKGLRFGPPDTGKANPGAEKRQRIERSAARAGGQW